MILLRELIKLTFNTTDWSLKKISLKDPDWVAGTVIINYISKGLDTGYENWEEFSTYKEIVDDGVEKSNIYYAENYYIDIVKWVEKTKLSFNGDLFTYVDRFKQNRNMFIANKEQQEEIIKFLLFLGWDKKSIEINPDFEDEAEDAENAIEDALQDAMDDAKELEYMRRSSYRW